MHYTALWILNTNLMDGIESSKDLSGDNEKAVEAAIQDFKATNCLLI